MNNYLFGNTEQFLYGVVCSNEPDNVSNFKKDRPRIDVEIDSHELAPKATFTNFPIVNKIPVQTASVSEVLERNLRWDKVLPGIRKIWGCTQVEMAEILGISEKTVLNIEKNSSRPNTVNRKKLFLLRELSSFLLRELERNYAIKNLLSSKLPAMGMLTPKEFLKGGEADSFREALGIFKRMYR